MCCFSPLPSRPPSPMSDTEIDRQHMEEKHQQHLKDSSATWDWGQLPKQPLSPNDCKMDNQQIDNFLDRKGMKSWVACFYKLTFVCMM